MDHISPLGQHSVRWTRKKYLGYKKLQGGKKPIRKTEKKVAIFFFFFPFFFGDSTKFVGGGKKISRGAPNGNVTPLVSIALLIPSKLHDLRLQQCYCSKY